MDYFGRLKGKLTKALKLVKTKTRNLEKRKCQYSLNEYVDMIEHH